MNIYEFMNSNPILTFFMACMIYYTIRTLLFVLPNRICRHKNILRHGYPPPHCDADGDFKMIEDKK